MTFMLYSFTPVDVLCAKLLYLSVRYLSAYNLLLGDCIDSGRISSDYEFASKRFITKTKCFTHKISFRRLFPAGMNKLMVLQVLIWLVRTLHWQYNAIKLQSGYVMV